MAPATAIFGLTLPGMSFSKSKTSQQGYTLVELLLYITLLGAMLGAVSLFVVQLLSARVKSETIAEVEQQGSRVMHLISQTIRNAQAITSPTTGSNAASATIDVVTVADDPTVFDLAGGAIRITEGAGAPVALTGSTITASGLDFDNRSRASTPGTLRIEFTLTRTTTSSRNEFDYSKTFYGSASVRP